MPSPRTVSDAHRHLGVLPAFPFYGGPAIRPDITARATIAELFADLDSEGTERALVLPNYGVPSPEVAFGFNDLVLGDWCLSPRGVAGCFLIIPGECP